MSDSILEFENVAVEGDYPYDTPLKQISFRLRPGELLLVHLESEHLHNPLADAAQGIIDPIQGRVRYLGHDWRERHEDAVFAARSTIGRVYDDPGWLSELDLEENITLGQRHHTDRSESEIRDEASKLARLFSLAGLPQERADGIGVPVLRRAACIRALIGNPSLIILERPTAGVYQTMMSALMTSLRAARARGAAILWTTADHDVFTDMEVRPTQRAQMSGAQLRLLPKD